MVILTNLNIQFGSLIQSIIPAVIKMAVKDSPFSYIPMARMTPIIGGQSQTLYPDLLSFSVGWTGRVGTIHQGIHLAQMS